MFPQIPSSGSSAISVVGVVGVEPYESYAGAEEGRCKKHQGELAQKQLQAANMHADLMALYTECKRNGSVISPGELHMSPPDKARHLLALFVECKKADEMVDKAPRSNPSYLSKQDTLYSSAPLQDWQNVVRPCSPCSSQDPSGFSDDMNEDRK